MFVKHYAPNYMFVDTIHYLLGFNTFNINVYGPYKWGSKFDLGGKKVKCQHRTIILAILVDLLSPIICAKIRTQGLFGYGEEDF